MVAAASAVVEGHEVIAEAEGPGHVVTAGEPSLEAIAMALVADTPPVAAAPMATVLAAMHTVVAATPMAAEATLTRIVVMVTATTAMVTTAMATMGMAITAAATTAAIGLIGDSDMHTRRGGAMATTPATVAIPIAGTAARLTLRTRTITKIGRPGGFSCFIAKR